MDISKAIRDPYRVMSTLHETEDHKLITKTGCYITVPVGYCSKDLAVVGSEVSIIGIFAIFSEDNVYSVSLATSMMSISPTLIRIIKVGLEDYYRFDFSPGSVVINNTMLVKSKKIVNNILDYFIDYGKSPWFINYADMAEILSDTSYYNMINLADSQVVYDIIAASISRAPDDIRKYYRHHIKTNRELQLRPRFIPQRNIGLGATSNFALLNGSELKKGIKAALLNEDNRPEPLEALFIK